MRGPSRSEVSEANFATRSCRMRCGSSTLMPSSLPEKPKRRAPSTSPACVPPEEEAKTIQSAFTPCRRTLPWRRHTPAPRSDWTHHRGPGMAFVPAAWLFQRSSCKVVIPMRLFLSRRSLHQKVDPAAGWRWPARAALRPAPGCSQSRTWPRRRPSGGSGWTAARRR